EHTVARQIGADVEVVGKRRQAKIAGRRSREQRTRLGIELAEAQEVAGDVAGQNGEIALHVTRSDAGGLALGTAAAGRGPRGAAGRREERRSANRGKNRHGAFLLGRAENAGTGCLSYHQRARGTPPHPRPECLDRPAPPATSRPRCGGACPEVSYNISRSLLTEGSMRAAPRPPRPQAPMVRHARWEPDLGGTDDDQRYKNVEQGILVPRQAHAPPLDRIRHSRGRARREHAGAGAMAGSLWPSDEARPKRTTTAA